MDEVTATPEVGVEAQSTSENDAALLSDFLEQEDSSHDGVEAATDEVTVEEQAPTESELFTVKINGVEKQVTRDELITRYQKDEASGQKFEEAANLRRDSEQQKAVALQERQQLQNAINHFAQTAQQWAAQGQPNWADLLENNPHEYLRQKTIFEARQVEINRAQAAQTYLNQQNQFEQQQQVTQHLQTEGQRLIELVPEWKDVAVRQSEERELVAYLTKQGYSQQELENLNHSKASNIKLVLNAMRYEKLVQQSSVNNKRVNHLPPRVERPGVSSNGDKSGFAEAKQRLSRSGSIDDAAAAFSAMFG